jgi:hypothetical protein
LNIKERSETNVTRPNSTRDSSERYLINTRRAPRFTRVRTPALMRPDGLQHDARPDRVCFKVGRMPISLGSSVFLPYFYTVFHLKTIIS